MKKLLILMILVMATNTLVAQTREVKTETQTKRYYVDENGKKKYLSNSKTQKMWDDILKKCPSCLSEAKKYNVNIWQNTDYKKPTPTKKKEDN